MANPVTRAKPRKIRIADGSNTKPCNVMIHKDSDGEYRVDKIYLSKKATVTWKADNFTPDEIVIFFPEPPGTILRAKEPAADVDGSTGVYHYSVYVCEGQGYYAVEGNSPPEMIIE